MSSNAVNAKYIAIIGAAKYLLNKYLMIAEPITPDVHGSTITKLIKITMDDLDYPFYRDSPPGSCSNEESQYRVLVSWHNQTVHEITTRNPGVQFETFPLSGPADGLLPALESMLKFLAKELDYVPTWYTFEDLTSATREEVLENCIRTKGRILETPILAMYCMVNSVPTIAGCILESVHELSRSVHVYYADKQFMTAVTEHHVSKKLEEIRRRHLDKGSYATAAK